MGSLSNRFSSATNRPKYSPKSVGFVSPHQIAMDMGGTCGSSKNRLNCIQIKNGTHLSFGKTHTHTINRC